ncbi:MAG: acyl-CoA reductase [Elusimicrobiota bacterium]
MKIKNTYIFGKSLNKSTWTEKEILEIGRQARDLTNIIKQISRDYIIDVLSKTGKLFKNKNSIYRKTAIAHLKESITFSAPVIEKSLEVIPEILDKQTMLKRMNLEMFLPYALETAIERRGYDGLIRAMPKGVVLHVGAGNVFLGILDSLVLGLLTKNINIVKISSTGSNFINIFIEALKSVDTRGIISKSVAILSWKGGAQELEQSILMNVDSVLVWGGYDAVQSYRKMAPIHVRVEGFGPKTSFGIVFENAVRNYGMAEIAQQSARDAGFWDQAACSSLHTLYFVSLDNKRRKKFIKEFLTESKKAFSLFQKELPQGKLSEDEKVEITKAREIAKVDRALGNAELLSSFPKTEWTVIYEKDPAYRISPLNRVLYVKAVEKLEDIKAHLMPYKGYLQTAGVAGSILDRKHVLETLYETGIARVVKLGKMLEGANGSPHDGIFPMMALVNWIGIEERPCPLDKLIEITEHAKNKSSFYKRHFAKTDKIVTLEDFHKLPFLEKHHVLENTPPDSPDLLTSKVQHGIFFASGGSTGQPKYVFYDQHEYDSTCRMLAFAYEAGGLNEQDVIANLFVAGNLWSSWLSVEKAIAYTKAISVPIGSHLPVENIVQYLKDFKVTAIIGLPSFLIKLAEFVEGNKGKYALHIKKIFYGGEYVGDETIKFFNSVFPGVAVRSAGYATADAGVVGFQCEKCLKGTHHLFAFSQYIEFVNPETLKPVKKEEIGELIVTSLTKRHMPIIRYRVGDLGRWLDKNCACGRKEPLFEILGRIDDRIHVGGAHLFVNDIQNAIGKVPQMSLNFQVIVDKKQYKDLLKIRVEAKNEKYLQNKEIISKNLLGEIEKNCEDLKESIKSGLIEKPEIEIIMPGSIERIHRTGKIKKVIDKRIKR